VGGRILGQPAGSVIARHTFANVRSEVIPQAGAAGGVGGEFRDRFPGFEGRSSGDNPGRRPGGTGGFGGPGGNASVSGALVTLLQTGASGYEWAATVGSDSAASMELSTGGDPVMAIGGFSGSDPAPALAENSFWELFTRPAGGTTVYDLTAPAQAS
jgi:hypothetical protein